MKTGSLRLRVTAATVALLIVVVGVVLAAVAITYQASLRSDLRHRLLAADATVAATSSASTAKQLSRGLVLEGIAATVLPPQSAPSQQNRASSSPVNPGAITATGSLLSLTEVLPDHTVVTFTASDAAASRSVANLLRLEAAIGLAGLAGAALAAIGAAKTTMRPLSRISDTATAIAAGDTTRRLAPHRTDTEIGAMAAAFDRMVDSLETAAATARHAEAVKSRFVADAAHELRTPVAALQASAERLLREQPDRPDRDQLEAAIASRAAGLGRLIADLLSLSRLNAVAPRPGQIVDLAAATEAAVADARLRADGTTIRLDASHALVRGDCQALHRAVRNLLDNALAAAPGGNVTVTLSRPGHHATITVADNGPGIPDADRERIFEPFARLAATPTTGTGLGLAIARRIARQHGGDLTCDRTGGGASFTLWLPAGQTHSPTATRAGPPALRRGGEPRRWTDSAAE